MIFIYFPFSNLIEEKEKPKTLMYQGFRLWRRARDSNPRNAFDVYTISNRAYFVRTAESLMYQRVSGFSTLQKPL